MNMTNEEILQIALQQSAYDCNCDAKDFLQEENKIVLSEKNEKQGYTYHSHLSGI